MPRYIDIEGYRKLFDAEYKKTRELINQGETHLDNLAEGFSEASRVIDRIPLADVVPRSEVEELRKDHYQILPDGKIKLIPKTDIDAWDLSCGQPIGKILADELDKRISEDIVAVFKKYFPNTTIDEKRVLKLARLLICDEEDCTKVSSGDICVVCGEHVPEGRQICSMCETGKEFRKKRKGDDVG